MSAANKPMRLFLMDDYEYWIGPDADACKAAYIKERGPELSDDLDPTEVNAAAVLVDLSEEGDGSGPLVSGDEFMRRELETGGDFPRYAFAIDS
jgi:hypothetical protein